MKIRIFSGDSLIDIENKVNKFLNTVNVKDIKFTSGEQGYFVTVIYNETING